MCLCFVCALLYTGAWAQAFPQRDYLGLEISQSFVAEDLTDGRHFHSLLVAFQHGINVTPDRAQLPFITMARIHAGLNNTMTDGKRDFELGGVAGVETHYTFAKSLRISAALFGGPAYISVENEKQASGFLFGSYASLALVIPVGQGGLYIRPGIQGRHMSNLSLQEPNVGLDSVFFVLGIGKQRYSVFADTR